MRRSNPALPRISLFEFRRARSGVYEFLLKSGGHCLLFSVAGATANRETLLFNFTAIKLSSGLPNVPARTRTR
jgi:hypothetical protein